jgi:hypothetical protein
VDPDKLAITLATVEPQNLNARMPSVHALRHRCVACEHYSWLYCESEYSNPADQLTGSTQFDPLAFYCHVCDLELDDVGLAATGLSRPLKFEELDPVDLRHPW